MNQQEVSNVELFHLLDQFLVINRGDCLGKALKLSHKNTA